jgi:bile acid:Na+ symporter, BASS family
LWRPAIITSLQGNVNGMQTLIQVLTAGALAGLLGAVGLRTTWGEIRTALSKCHFTGILVVNFVAIPFLSVVAAVCLGLSHEIAVATILLAAAPFAPVVPVFARMARADLALAAGLTAVYPVLSVVFTPMAAQGALWLLAQNKPVRLNLLTSLGVLLSTISLPLAAGVLLRHRAPRLGQRLLRPVEVLAEATGAASLALVTTMEFHTIRALGWRAWTVMALMFEISLVMGWVLGGPGHGARRVVALGTSNRNIALALLVAFQNFSQTEVISAVAGNGLLLIGMGLLHVGWWRFVSHAHAAS